MPTRGPLKLYPSMGSKERIATINRMGVVSVVQSFAALAILAGSWGLGASNEGRDRLLLAVVVAMGVAAQGALVRYYRRPVVR
jgi:hypothetical protein